MDIHPRLLALYKKIGTNQPASVQIAMGELFPLTEESLRDQWSELTGGKMTLSIRIIRAELQCMVCFEKYHPAQKETACPHCASMGAKVLAGEECFIE